MAKTVDLTFPIPMTAGAVRGRLMDPAELERLAQASAPLASAAEVRPDGTSVISRVYAAPSTLRSFLKSDSIELLETRVPTQQGFDVHAEVTGLPITITGTLEFKEHDDRCVLHVVVTIEARIGLASALAEAIVREHFEQAVRAEAESLA